MFRRLPRVVRDTAKQLGREVEIVIAGENTDLDKSILDALAEPMMHLLRNAVDHGIEPPLERAAAGKSPVGTIRLNAYHQGNQVVIEISDDGKGIQLEKVVASAVSRGVITAEQALRLSDNDALDLIFHAGLSTANQVTEVSGRGIGMDVVKAVMDRLKGAIAVRSTPGEGSTFRLMVPLTLAIIKALLFRVCDRLYAVPLGNVLEILRSRESEVHVVDGQEVLQIREEVVPLIRLSRIHSGGVRTPKLYVIVVSHGDRKIGLVVDRLIGEQELVIKGLDETLINTELVSGASILGDGRVVLILSISDVVAKLGGGLGSGYSRRHGVPASGGAAVTVNPQMIRVLVVDDSALMRKLIPQLLERDNSIHVVGTAMDGAFALKKIEELRPDAITLDLEMPRMDGIETLRQIMRQLQVPVVVVSAHTREGASTTFKALHMGAFDFVAKPENVLGEGMNEIASEMIEKIKAAVKSPFTRRPILFGDQTGARAKAKRPHVVAPASKVIALGISTGGPNSLEYMLSQLPAEFPPPSWWYSTCLPDSPTPSRGA